MEKLNKRFLKQMAEHRKEFLTQHPNLQPLQDEIDRFINAAGEDPMARVFAVNKVLMDLIDSNLLPSLTELAEMLEMELAQYQLSKQSA